MRLDMSIYGLYCLERQVSMTYRRGFFVARLDGGGMRKPQVVGRVTGQGSHAFLCIMHVDREFSGAKGLETEWQSILARKSRRRCGHAK